MPKSRAPWIAGACVLLLLSGAAALRPRPAEGEEPAAGPAGDAGRFIVHEWGTFTSMHGTDGAVLDGLTREEEALPGFVHSRTEVRDCPLREKGWKGLEVPADHVTQKMETPVIYFHSATPRRARVRVDFRRGLLTQWYPVSDLLGPPELATGAGNLDLAKIESSFLEWDLEVLGRGAADRPDEVPAVAADDPWQFAREVEANWVRTMPRKPPAREGPVEAERYLFYRGLGRFDLALAARAGRDGDVTVTNTASLWDGANPEPLEGAFALQVATRGGIPSGRIKMIDPVPPGATHRLRLDPDHWTHIDDIDEKLRSIVTDRLIRRGLHRDEARAMVRTWSRSWFRSPGTRVIWFVPQRLTERILPLVIQPSPDALVRVLVGRSELVTPEEEAEVESALRDRWSGDPALRAASVARLAACERFLEPQVRNVLAKTKDEVVRRNGERVLAELLAAGRAAGPASGEK